LALQAADEVHINEADLAYILKSLDEREFVHVLENTQFEGTTSYIFNHAMLRDVIYDNLLKSQRRMYHLCMAEWLVQQSHARPEEYNALIAEHYEKAGKSGEAGEYLRDEG
jgi:predicted ATPase